MDFDRARAEEEPLADLRIGEALAHQSKRFSLAPCQLGLIPLQRSLAASGFELEPPVWIGCSRNFVGDGLLTTSRYRERVGDCLREWHRLAGGKRRVEPGFVQRGTNGRDNAIDVQRVGNPRPAGRHLLGGNGAQQARRSYGLVTIKSDPSQSRDRPHDHVFISDFLRNGNELGKQLCGQRGIALRTGEMRPLAESLGNAPWVPDLPVEAKPYVDQRSRAAKSPRLCSLSPKSARTTANHCGAPASLAWGMASAHASTARSTSMWCQALPSW